VLDKTSTLLCAGSVAILKNEGLEGEATARGKRSRGVDWQTSIDGEPIGVTLLDSPFNLSSKPVGTIYRSRVLIHPEITDENQINEEFAADDDGSL
jgi:hypothetical protein